MKKRNSFGKEAHFSIAGNLRCFASLLLLTFLITTVSISYALAAPDALESITLEWNAADTAPEAYRVYQRLDGAAYNYDQWRCHVQTATCIVSDLAPNTTYHFVVRSYIEGKTGKDSNEVTHTTAPATQPSYTITASAGANGRITPNGQVTVTEGNEQHFTITADNGYHISDVLVDDQSVGAVSSYAFTDITDHHRIMARFSLSNRNPMANAGEDQTVDVGRRVTLDGSASNDPDDGDAITGFQWRQIAGTAVQMTEANTAQARFTAPDVAIGGEALEFELIVTDSAGAKATDQCIVNVTKENSVPKADAGGLVEVNEGAVALLNGSGSKDPDDDPISYEWIQTLGPRVALTAPKEAQTKFFAPDVEAAGATLSFQLTVTDSYGLKSTDNCTVKVAWVNSPPIANAGNAQSVSSGQLVHLNASGCSDPDGNLEKYQWVQTSGPSVTLSDPSSRTPSFTAPQVDAETTELVFELTVSDTEEMTSKATCEVTVHPEGNADTDNDGHNDDVDAFPENADEWLDSDKDGIGNNADMDDDGDGMPDEWEVKYGLNPLDPKDADMDMDNDGLTNGIEARNDTDPTHGETTVQWMPSVISPAEGDSHISTSNPTFEIDTKGHQEHGLEIHQTLWQILSEDGGKIIFNGLSDRKLSNIRIPLMILAPETDYRFKARCYDNRQKMSKWSAAVRFKTDPIPNDADLNGVPDNREVTVGSNPDMKEDVSATLVSDRSFDVAAVDLAEGSTHATLVSAMHVFIEEIEETPGDELPTPKTMVSNKIVTDPGKSVTLRFILSKPQKETTLRCLQYDAVNGWQDNTDNARLSQNGEALDVTIEDGGPGDADGTANGTIVNMSGLATKTNAAANDQSTPTSTDSKNSNSSGGSGSGIGIGSQCFIQSIIN